MSKVIAVGAQSLSFDDDTRLESQHESSCCEDHWLSFEHLTLADFEGLEFDLTNNKFFERVEGFGIRLIPLSGHPVSVPGYGSNSGYYSDKLELVVSWPKKGDACYDITECQTY